MINTLTLIIQKVNENGETCQISLFSEDNTFTYNSIKNEVVLNFNDESINRLIEGLNQLANK
jgi:hypothetical protein